MKNFLIGLIVLGCTIFTSCTTDDSISLDSNFSSLESRSLENSGIWYITEYSKNGTNLLQNFSLYQIQFNANKMVTVSTANSVINGTWNNLIDNNKNKLVLMFPSNSSLEELSEDWEILVSNSTQIDLKHVSGSKSKIDILKFGRTPNKSIDQGGNPLSTIPINGQWLVSRYLDKDRDRTSYYAGFSFDFKSTGVLTATKGSTVVNGSWKKYNDSGKTKLDIIFPDIQRMAELNEDWEVLNQTSNSILLKNVSGGNGGISYLDFKK